MSASPAPEATGPHFTEKEERVLKVAWLCLKSGPPEVDIDKLQTLAGFATRKTTSNTWSAIKKKLMEMAPDADGEDNPKTPATGKSKGKATPKASTTKKASGKKPSAKKSKAELEGTTDSDDGPDVIPARLETPFAKAEAVKTPKRVTSTPQPSPRTSGRKRKATAKAAEEDVDIDSEEVEVGSPEKKVKKTKANGGKKVKQEPTDEDEVEDGEIVDEEDTIVVASSGAAADDDIF